MVSRVSQFFVILFLAGASTVGLGARPVWGAEIKRLTVFHQHNTYHVSFDAVVDAPAQEVYGVLSDYEQLDRLSPVIVAIAVQPQPQGTGQRVRSVLRSCFVLFCKEIVEVEDVTETNEQTIAAEIVPGAGDFQSGYSRWRLRAVGARTQLHYEATRTPSFWIPPLLGPWMIKATMRTHLESSVAALERLVEQNTGVR